MSLNLVISWVVILVPFSPGFGAETAGIMTVLMRNSRNNDSFNDSFDDLVPFCRREEKKVIKLSETAERAESEVDTNCSFCNSVL